MKVDESQILVLLEKLEKDSEGWASTRKLVDEIQKEFICSLPTAYSIIHRTPVFETRHGKIRTSITHKPIRLDVSYYQEWLKTRETFLDKAVEFLSEKKNIEELLVYIGVIREQLKDGVDNELENLFYRLTQKFGANVIESAVEEGKILRVPPRQESEIVRQLSAEEEKEPETKISIFDEEDEEEEEPEVEEVLPSSGEEL